MVGGAMKRSWRFEKNKADLGTVFEILRGALQDGVRWDSKVRVQVYLNGSIRQIDVENEAVESGSESASGFARNLQSAAAGTPVTYPNKDDGSGRVSYIHGSPVEHPTLGNVGRNA